MKLNLALIALNGVLGGRNPMNHLDSVFGVANDFVSTFEGDYPNIKGASRQKQYTKAVSNLTRIWNRCGNDSDGNAVQDELDRALSNDVCKAIGQVTGKFESWTTTYLATCKEKRRANPLAKFPRMEANMKRAAGCNKKDDGY